MLVDNSPALRYSETLMSNRLAGVPEGPTIYPGAPSAHAPASTLRALVAELRAICSDQWVYTHEHQLRTYESDALLQYQVLPVAAVLPGTAEEVQAVVAACARARVPWVARGAAPDSREVRCRRGRRAARAHP